MDKPKRERFQVPMAQIRSIMGNVHVGEPMERVRADAEQRARDARWKGRKLTAKQQQAVVDAFLQVHRENVELYNRVMGGML